MKYKLGDNHIGRNDIIRIAASPFSFTLGTYSSQGKIDAVDEKIYYNHRIWDSKYSLEDVYFTGFGGATLNPMKILLSIYAGGIGESYSTHSLVDTSYNMASVVANIYRKESILSLMSGVSADDNVFYKLGYDATAGEETSFYVHNIIHEYKLK